MTDPTNRRTYPRFEISLAAEINTGQSLFAAQAKNLSQGGVGLALSEALSENAAVGISLFIVEDGIEDETTATLDVQGHVIWTAQTDAGTYETGVRFTPLPPNQVKLLEHFLRRLGG